jgi:hypothetical protein
VTRRRVAATAAVTGLGVVVLLAAGHRPAPTAALAMSPTRLASARTAAVRLVAAASDLGPHRQGPPDVLLRRFASPALAGQLATAPSPLTVTEATNRTRQRLTVTATSTQITGPDTATVRVTGRLHDHEHNHGRGAGLVLTAVGWTCQLQLSAGRWLVVGVS